MKVTLVGMGCGETGTLTVQGQQALAQADYLVGAGRLLEAAPVSREVPRYAAIQPQEILACLSASKACNPCVLYSGDTGFYSGASGLIPLLEERNIPFQIFPGLSSVQALAAKLNQSWQGWTLYSSHGRDCDPVAAVCRGTPAFFLTGKNLGPAELCRILSRAGLGSLPVTIGENLFCKGEKIYSGIASDFMDLAFEPLSVMLAQPAFRTVRRVPGIPDDEFIRERVPMTKQEVRTVILSKLAVGPEDVCWDIGAGTGSVSVELAVQCREVWAVEQAEPACRLILENQKKFGAWNLHLTKGTAPAVLAELPPPDKVFVGGSSGKLKEIFSAVHRANPKAAICVSAIALETLHSAVEGLEALGYETEVVQISVSRTKRAGQLHMLMAQNPVFLISGVRPCGD